MSGQDSDNPTNATVAETPFNDSNADIILRSSDDVLFYVHSLLLSLASSVFSDMFTLPRSLHSQEMHDGRLCIAVSDDPKHLRLLLSWCDPRCMQVTTCLPDLQMVLETADKYGMVSIIKRVESVLILSKGMIKENPLKIYAIAVRYRYEDLARIAATETLRHHPLIKLTGAREPELKHLSAFAFINLEEYHLRCVAAAVKVVSEYSWMGGPRPRSEDRVLPYFMNSCENMPYYEEDEGECPTATNQFGTFLIWWIDYMELCAEALKQVPIGASVADPLLLSAIHSKISNGSCQSCRNFGHDKLLKFAMILAAEIVSTIELMVEVFSIIYNLQ